MEQPRHATPVPRQHLIARAGDQAHEKRDPEPWWYAPLHKSQQPAASWFTRSRLGDLPSGPHKVPEAAEEVSVCFYYRPLHGQAAASPRPPSRHRTCSCLPLALDSSAHTRTTKQNSPTAAAMPQAQDRAGR